ncbi:MAG: hypothetical protein OEP52_06795 [Acidimicrobiia bacterium]|nr:hypothetical protein [Acidimicrobiia bacterium]
MDLQEDSGVIPEPDVRARGSRPAPELRFVVAAAAAFSVAYFFALTRLVRGNILNSYPFIPNDGFDWLLEGYAVSRWFDGLPIPELPLARNPGFVGVIFADFHIGANGDLLFAVVAVSVFASITAGVLIAYWRNIPAYQAGVIALAMALTPVGFFRQVILADQLAATLMVFSAVALYPYFTRGSRGWLATAMVTAVAGGLTQIYGMMAFLIVAGWCFTVSVKRRQPDRLLAGAMVVQLVATYGITRWWLSVVPHAGTPQQFEVLQLNFNMLDFYSDAWAFAFGPLVPLVIVLLVWRRREVMASPVLSGYWLTVLVLLVSTFFYQFEEFRFTLPTVLMLGVALMATLPGARPLPRPRYLMAATAVLVLLAGLFVVPVSYWSPELTNLEFGPSHSYFGRLLDVTPSNRFELEKQCQSSYDFCSEVLLPDSIPGYRRNSLLTYQYLANLDR